MKAFFLLWSWNVGLAGSNHGHHTMMSKVRQMNVHTYALEDHSLNCDHGIKWNDTWTKVSPAQLLCFPCKQLNMYVTKTLQQTQANPHILYSIDRIRALTDWQSYCDLFLITYAPYQNWSAAGSYLTKTQNIMTDNKSIPIPIWLFNPVIDAFDEGPGGAAPLSVSGLSVGQV